MISGVRDCSVIVNNAATYMELAVYLRLYLKPTLITEKTKQNLYTLKQNENVLSILH